MVDEVLDRLNIDRCSIMAHSAGAPYALSFASKYPERVVGDVCLLAPWVGGGAGGIDMFRSVIHSLLIFVKVDTDGCGMFQMVFSRLLKRPNGKSRHG